MVLICGIDEAGKGSVIGPLAIAGVLIDESDLDLIKDAKDSKLLTHPQRIGLCKRIEHRVAKYKVISIEPEEIDRAVGGQDGLNLNWLEAIKIVEIINELKPEKAFIDCPSSNIKAYTSYLRERLDDKNVELIVEHKADTKYKTVSAASILAKCRRESEVLKIEKKVGESIGSGYPSNKVCQKFLQENWDKYPTIFRKSWASYQRVVKKQWQSMIGDY
jgi:ribonuclease HII